jgi:hypothetical protein
VELNWNIAYRISIAFYYNLHSEKEGCLVSNVPSTTTGIADVRLASWSANPIEPRDDPIATKHAILEIVSANSVALFSHVYFSQSALTMTVLYIGMLVSHHPIPLRTVVSCGGVVLFCNNQ